MVESKLIRGGTLVTPPPGGELRADLLISGERIAAIGIDLPCEQSTRAVDATGCMVDPHTHIQLDTGIHQTPDNWEVGTRTAACGGVTTVIDFATQLPGQDVRQALDARLTQIGQGAQVDFGLHMMLTALPPDDKTLDDWMAELGSAGVPSAKVYTTYRPNYYQDDAALLRVFKSAAHQHTIIMVHCENDALVTAATQALVAEGKVGLAYHGQARPVLAEVEAANRALFLATDVRLYVVHCSSSGTVDQVISARDRNQQAVAETTPQYLLLDESIYFGQHPEVGIMQPPLRSAEETQRLWAQVVSGAISTIGTDHCDYTIAQKREYAEFTRTPGGIPGLETLLPLLATHGVASGRINWPRLAELTSANPARFFGLADKGKLAPGYDADVVVYDPRPKGVIRSQTLHNLAGYTPYEGWKVQGRVRDVFVRGRQLVRDGEFIAAPGWGRFVPGKEPATGTW